MSLKGNFHRRGLIHPGIPQIFPLPQAAIPSEEQDPPLAQIPQGMAVGIPHGAMRGLLEPLQFLPVKTPGIPWSCSYRRVSCTPVRLTMDV